MKLVRITWIDSVTNGGWKHDEDIDAWVATAPWAMQSVGYVVRETDRFLVLASSRSLQGKQQYSCLTIIPRAVVQTVEVLSET